MILKDIANEINMDISTVSRVANSKSVQTEFGIYPLKYFFSEGIATDSGDDVSSREVKSYLKELIDQEDKKKPLSDDKLEKLLNQKGYNIANFLLCKSSFCHGYGIVFKIIQKKSFLLFKVRLFE